METVLLSAVSQQKFKSNFSLNSNVQSAVASSLCSLFFPTVPLFQDLTNPQFHFKEPGKLNEKCDIILAWLSYIAHKEWSPGPMKSIEKCAVMSHGSMLTFECVRQYNIDGRYWR